MRWIFLALALLACNPPCKTSSDCEAGEHCELNEGRCIQGCTSNADCAATAICNLRVGNCVALMPLPRPDVGTSTTADAG